MVKDSKKAAEQCCEEVDPREGKVNADANLMVICFERATWIMEKEGLWPEPALVSSDLGAVQIAGSELKTVIALALFQKSTRVIPEQEKIFGKAIEYMNLLTKEKVEQMERSEELRDSVPFMPTFGVTTVQSAMCEHPGLKMLYDKLDGFGCDSYVGKVLEEILEGMRMSGPTDDHPGFFICGHCRSLIPLDAFRSGEPWNESAEASRRLAGSYSREKKETEGKNDETS